MSRTVYSQRFKAEALADLLAGDHPLDVAKRYGINPGTVKRWHSEQQRSGALTTAQHRTPAGDDIGDLVVSLLAARLKFLAAAATTLADPEWLKSQSANDLALLIGVTDDKTYRVLEALERARSASTSIESA